MNPIIKPGTLKISRRVNDKTVYFEEGVDYVCDYAAGEIKWLKSDATKFWRTPDPGEEGYVPEEYVPPVDMTKPYVPGKPASISGQFWALGLSILGDLLWFPVIIILAIGLDKLLIKVLDDGFHWSFWLLIWCLPLLAIGKVYLYNVRDVDGDGR